MMAVADRWSDAKRIRKNNRKAYYISAEYLIGRLVYSNLFNLGILEEMKQLFLERGVDLAVLSSASLQDMVRIFKTTHGSDLTRFPEFFAVQLNDTHPAMSIPKLPPSPMKLSLA